MKNFLKTLLAITLATAFLLTGCETPNVSGEDSSNTREVSSKTSTDVSEPTSSSVSEDSSIENSQDKALLLDIEGEITHCTDKEASDYLETDEAKKLATFFGTCINKQSFSTPLELMEKASSAFFWFMQDTMLDMGTVDENGAIVALKKSVANEYLEKYFGIQNYDPKDYEFYDKNSGEYQFPHPAGKTMWIVQDIKLESIEGNECTFRYVYSYVADEPPYWSARITFKVMKDGNGAFLQLVSCTDVVSEVATIQEAIGSLYNQNLEWQSITCEVVEGQSLTFKLPKNFHPTENTEGNVGKSWTDGNFKVNVSGVYEKEYLQERMSIWPDAFVSRRTFLDNGIVDTILYPRKDYAVDEPSARSHFAYINCGDVIIQFEVSEPWYIDTPTMTTETLSMIKAITDSFE